MWKVIFNCFTVVCWSGVSKQNALSLALEGDYMAVPLFIINPMYDFVNILNELLQMCSLETVE